MPANRQLNFAGAFAIWASLIVFAAVYGAWRGFGGPRFAVALVVCALLLAGQLFYAVKNFRDRALARFAQSHGWLAVAAPLAALLIYAALVARPIWIHLLAVVIYAIAPAALVASAGEAAPGAWQDYVAVIAIWLPVGLRWLRGEWPYPPPLTHTLTALFALNVALAAFLFVRRLDGIGYSVEWGKGFSFAVGFNFIVFAAIAIPLGEAIGFIRFDPWHVPWKSLPLAALGIVFFTAWPEEFLFRGLIQNLLARTLKNPWSALIVASIIFGFAHINNGTFPNWRYVLLATIAGIFYGRAWMKTGSIFASCLVHALVDFTWHALFR